MTKGNKFLGGCRGTNFTRSVVLIAGATGETPLHNQGGPSQPFQDNVVPQNSSARQNAPDQRGTSAPW